MRIGNEKLILVTPDAGVKIKELIQREEKGDYLRIKITGGGCNGLSYKMKFVDQGKDKDILVESAGQSVLVDSKTALYLRGTTLDYSNKLVGGGFVFARSREAKGGFFRVYIMSRRGSTLVKG